MNDDPEILIESCVTGGIAELTLNHPSSRNALTIDMRTELACLLSSAVEDPAIRAIVISAEGKVFCSGGDLKSMTRETAASMLARQLNVQNLIRLLITGNTPVIAVVDGICIGAGLSLALACDIVVAGPSAKFAAVFGSVGLAPDLGMTWTLPARVGLGRARLMTMTNRMVNAREAVEWGLADIEADEALKTARKVAEEICNNAPLSNGIVKKCFATHPASLEQALRFEALAQTVMHSTNDFQEGFLAFKQKRTPQFKGN